MPKYTVILKDPSGNKWDFEKFNGLQWERYENEVGKCKIELPYNDSKLSEALTTDNIFMQILIYRDGTLVWQGFVAFILDTVDKTTIYGLDFKEILKWSMVGYNTAYTAQKIGSEIISPIWDIIDARANAALGDLITKGTIQDPYQTGTSNAKVITRTVMDEDFFTLLTEMVAVSRADSPSGAWEQNTVFDISLSEATPTFSFTRNVGTNKENVVFELNSEITDYYIPKDYRFIRNTLTGYSVISGPQVITSSQDDATSRSAYYRRELSPIIGAVSNSNELAEKVKDILKESKDPSHDVSFTFAAGLVPFDGYVMGDNVQVRVVRGRVSIKEYRRVVGMEVTIDDSGAELAIPILRKLRT